MSLTVSKTNLRLLTVALFLILGLFLLPNLVSAQSFEIQPSSGNIAIGGNHAVEIYAVSPPSGANTATIAITAPGSLVQFTDLIVGSGLFQFDCAGYSGGFSSDSTCVTIGKPGSGVQLEDGDLLFSLELTGIADGIASFDFSTVSGEATAYYNGSISTPYTGQGGIYTIGAGGGEVLGGTASTLPEAGLTDNPKDLAFFLGFLLILVLSINRISTILNLIGIPVKKGNFTGNLLSSIWRADATDILDEETIKNRQRKKLERHNNEFQNKVLKEFD